MENLIRSGQLDRLITIERETEIVRPSGTATKLWTAIHTLRAGVTHVEAVEAPASNGERTRERIKIRIRWVGAITTADRVVYSGRAYDILSVAEIGRRVGYELTAEAVS